MHMLPMVTLSLLIAGIAISTYALNRYGNRAATDRLTWRTRHLTPVWKSQDWFTIRKGFVLYNLGTYFLVLGALSGAVYFLITRC